MFLNYILNIIQVSSLNITKQSIEFFVPNTEIKINMLFKLIRVIVEKI